MWIKILKQVVVKPHKTHVVVFINGKMRVFHIFFPKRQEECEDLSEDVYRPDLTSQI